MNTTEISRILTRDPYSSRYFIGAFPSNYVPSNLPSTYAAVYNFDKDDQPGSHWFALYVRRNTCHVFDSYGTMPNLPYIRRLCSRYAKVYYNALKIQTDDEITCAGYAIYVICEMARGRSFQHIVTFFKKKPMDDAFIRRYLLENHGFRLAL